MTFFIIQWYKRGAAYFESKDVFSLHMVKDTADMLYAIACLLQGHSTEQMTKPKSGEK